MKNKRYFTISLFVFLFLTAFEAIGTSIYFLTFPSDSESQLFLGYSLTRLMLVCILFVLFFVCVWVAWYIFHNKKLADNIWKYFSSKDKDLSWLFSSLGLFFFLNLALILTPEYRFGAWAPYIQQLLPINIFCAIFSAQGLVLLIYWRDCMKRNAFSWIFKRYKQTFFASTFFIIGLLLFLFSALKLGNGLQRNLPYMNDVGVPILLTQILILLAFCGVLESIKKLNEKINFDYPIILNWFFEHKDTFISLGIWLFTAILWIRDPMRPGYFFPKPFPPNNEFYPFSDAAIWDAWAQRALIGYGIPNTDHAGYVGFLAILHIFVGQNYVDIVNIQTAVFSIFPVILYWLGKSIHGRRAGFILAGLAIFHELNAYKLGKFLNLSHSKLLLTEFPTGIGLAFLSLLLFNWLIKSKPSSNKAYGLPIGGTLAVLILLRFNTLVMPIAVVIGIILIFKRDWIGLIKSLAIVFLAVTITLSPWMWQSWKLDGTPFFFASKASLLLQKDFRTPDVSPSPDSIQPDSFEKLPLIKNSLVDYSTFAEKITISEKYSQELLLSLNHFVNNLVTSILVLPSTPIFHDLRHIIYEAHPYWGKVSGHWLGELTFIEVLGLAINLIIISIGVGISWQKWKLAGLIPLGTYLTYNFATALARTSGGRYIVPIIWVIFLYFSLGLVQIISWSYIFFDQNVRKKSHSLYSKPFPFRNGVILLVPFVLFVGTITFISETTSPRHNPLSKAEVLEMLKQETVFQENTLDFFSLEKFLEDPNADAFIGLNLYPRYYLAGQGETSAIKTAYSSDEFPKLAFVAIGTFGEQQVVFPLSKAPYYFPNATDVIVIGCKEPNQMFIGTNALLVAVLGDKTVIYMREPQVSLQCPFPEP